VRRLRRRRRIRRSDRLNLALCGNLVLGFALFAFRLFVRSGRLVSPLRLGGGCI
jgi:hypothetical protein